MKVEDLDPEYISNAVAEMTAYLQREIEKHYGKLKGLETPLPIQSQQVLSVISCLGAVVTGLVLRNNVTGARLDRLEKELGLRQVAVSKVTEEPN